MRSQNAQPPAIAEEPEEEGSPTVGGEELAIDALLASANLIERAPVLDSNGTHTYRSCIDAYAAKVDMDDLCLPTGSPVAKDSEFDMTLPLPNDIKEAILEGTIKNDYDEAFAYMLKMGEELKLKQVSK